MIAELYRTPTALLNIEAAGMNSPAVRTELDVTGFEFWVDSVAPATLAHLLNCMGHRLSDVHLPDLDVYTTSALLQLAQRATEMLTTDLSSRAIIFGEATWIGSGSESMKLDRRFSKLSYTYQGITVETEIYPSAIKMIEYILRQPQQIGIKNAICECITEAAAGSVAEEFHANVVEVVANRVRTSLKACLQVFSDHGSYPRFFPYLFTIRGTGYQFGYIESAKLLSGKVPRNAAPTDQISLYISASNSALTSTA